MLCVVWRGDGFHQSRADWTVPLMRVFVSAGTKQKGLSGRVLASARSQIMRGPIWAGNNTFLVSAFNLNAFGRGLALCERRGRISHIQRTRAHTHLDGEKRAIGLTAHMGATDTAHPLETIGAQATELFLFMPYFIHNQSYFLWPPKWTISQSALQRTVCFFLRLTGLFTNNEYYSCRAEIPRWVYCPSPPSLFICCLRRWYPKLWVVPLPSAGGSMNFPSLLFMAGRKKKMMFLCTRCNMSQHSGTKLESSRGPCLWLNCSLHKWPSRKRKSICRKVFSFRSTSLLTVKNKHKVEQYSATATLQYNTVVL